MAIAGASSAAVWVPASGLVASCAPADKRGVAYGLMIMGVGVTIALTGALTGAVQHLRGELAWREVWIVEGLLALLVLLLLLAALRPCGATPPGKVPLLRMRHLAGEVAAARICVAYGVYGIGFSLYVQYLIAALQELGGMSNAEANRTYGFLGIASIFGAILLAKVSDRVSRSRTLSDVLRPSDVATVFGAATVALAGAQFLAPPLGGWLADATGSFTATYIVAAAACVTSGIIAWWFPSQHGATPAAPPVTYQG